MRKMLSAVLLTTTMSVPAKAMPALVCKFTLMASTTLLNGGKFDAAPVIKPVTKADIAEMTVAAIDFKAGTAQVIGNAGTASLYAYQYPNTANFLEVTVAGNFMLLTVALPNGGLPVTTLEPLELAAVYSRHTVMFESIVASQYWGTCTAKN
jgi:hypothetical protein